MPELLCPLWMRALTSQVDSYVWKPGSYEPTGFAFMVQDTDFAWRRKKSEEAGTQGEEEVEWVLPWDIRYPCGLPSNSSC